MEKNEIEKLYDQIGNQPDKKKSRTQNMLNWLNQNNVQDDDNLVVKKQKKKSISKCGENRTTIIVLIIVMFLVMLAGYGLFTLLDNLF